MVKIFSTKFRIFKKASKMRDLLFQNNDVSMVIKMGLILKKEKQSRLNALFYSILLLLYIIYFSGSIIIVGEWNSSETIISIGFSLIFMVLSIIPSYFVLKQTNKWMKGYHELKDWGDLLDKYEIIPKQRYMALLDKDLNNLEKSSEE